MDTNTPTQPLRGLPFTPYPTVDHKEAQALIDRRFPHLAKSHFDPTICANGMVPFLLTLTFKPAQRDGRVTRQKVLTNRETMRCRHLALRYCRDALKQLDFHPLQMFLSDRSILWDNPAWADERDACIGRFASRLHLLPAHRFGEFMAQELADMHAAPQWATAQPDDALQRVYFVNTFVHAMALRLQMQARPGNQWRYRVDLYDPNTSLYGVSSFPQQLQDLLQHPEKHHLLSYLIGQEMSEERAQLALDSFAAQDPQRHVSIAQVETLAEAGLPPATWATDWSTNDRMALVLSQSAGLKGEVARFLHRLLLPDPSQGSWTSLVPMPGVDHSLLFHAMCEEAGPALEAWERLWASMDDASRAVALNGELKNQSHVLHCTDLFSDDRLSRWFHMARQLPTALQRSAIVSTPNIQVPPLICALCQHNPRLMLELLPLIREAAEGDPAQAAQLLQAHDRKGRSALEMSLRMGTQQVRALWLAEVLKLPTENAHQVLVGANRQLTPAWARLLKALDLTSLRALAQLYRELGLSAADIGPRLALPEQLPALPKLRTRASAHPARFQACLTTIDPFLPEPTRALLWPLLGTTNPSQPG